MQIAFPTYFITPPRFSGAKNNAVFITDSYSRHNSQPTITFGTTSSRTKVPFYITLALALSFFFLSKNTPDYKTLDFSGKAYKTWYNASLMTYGEKKCTEKFGSLRNPKAFNAVLNAALHFKDANLGRVNLDTLSGNEVCVKLPAPVNAKNWRMAYDDEGKSDQIERAEEIITALKQNAFFDKIQTPDGKSLGSYFRYLAMIQSIWESSHFDSKLFLETNNCFGIKKSDLMQRNGYTKVKAYPTPEHIKGKDVVRTLNFTVFPNIAACVDGYTLLLKTHLDVFDTPKRKIKIDEKYILDDKQFEAFNAYYLEKYATALDYREGIMDMFKKKQPAFSNCF